MLNYVFAVLDATWLLIRRDHTVNMQSPLLDGYKDAVMTRPCSRGLRVHEALGKVCPSFELI